jgi:hypothetical protein
VEAGKRQIDAIAERVRAVVGSRTDAEFHIRAMNTVLHQELGFGYDKTDPMGRTMRIGLLWPYLQTHKGNCQSMPILWLAVAQRLGYPVKGVLAPQHLFLRFENGAHPINVEATAAGVPTDEAMIRDLEIPAEAIRSGAFMRSLSKRELVAEQIGELGIRLFELRNLGDAEQLLLAAERIVPNSVAIEWTLAQVYAAIAAMRTQMLAVIGQVEQGKRWSKTVEVPEYRTALEHAKKATALGATPVAKEGYWIKKAAKGTVETSITTPYKPPKPFDVTQLVRPPRGVTVAPAGQVLVPVPAECPPPPACSSAQAWTPGSNAGGSACARCQRANPGLQVEVCVDALRDDWCRSCAAEPSNDPQSSLGAMDPIAARRGAAGSTSLGFPGSDNRSAACRLCEANQPAYSSCQGRMDYGDCRQCLSEGR